VWYNLGGTGNPGGMGEGGGWSGDMWELIDANLKTVPVSFFTTVMYSNIMSMFRSGAEGQIYGYDGKHEAYGFYVTAGMMGVPGFMLSLRGIVNSANNELDEYVFVSHFIPYQLHGTDHETQGSGPLWIENGQMSMDILGGLAGAAQGLVVSGGLVAMENITLKIGEVINILVVGLGHLKQLQVIKLLVGLPLLEQWFLGA